MFSLDLLFNLALLVALSVLSGFIDKRWDRNRRSGQLLQGLLFGGAAVLGMLRPLVAGPGLIFDGRSVMISLCALFFGPVAGSIASLLPLGLRIQLGGVGTLVGCLVILSSMTLGWLGHRRLRRSGALPSTGQLYGFGLLVHLAMMALMLGLPAELVWTVEKTIGPPVLLFYPLATILVGKILTDQLTARSALQALQRQARELQQRNVELERFNHTISHDLKSPLVTSMAFLSFLEQDLASDNRERIASDLHHLRTATRQMEQLLDGLLRFSRLGQPGEPPQSFFYDELIEEVQVLLGGLLRQHQVALEIRPCRLRLLAQRPRLLELWQNLIENAIKYRRADQPLQIRLGVISEPTATARFYVGDNGQGIEPGYAEKIFGLFEQLDRNTPGSGLGLALAKRIVEQYDGRIWVESAGAGQGCCFFFTLPAALADPRPPRC
ncbi:MAG: sensor histidine kinase [Desulfuromonas thiophila]|uniref:sensor histidine kinase n=1 Tax=Desulfuromonas thiophila TaxID=57664 RepID=UPI0024A9FACF|nr:sensor histidine kinase [Desulfuromonas thiophila]MDD3801250.1 sensor histidine kinase [Desulfuromonas thiophila]